MLRELPFHNKLNIVKTSKSFRRYARIYRIEIIDLKHPSVQLAISKPSIEDLFKDLVDEIKGFRYQVTLRFVKPIQRKYRHRICSCLF